VKRFDQLRAKRRKIYENLFSAKALCIAGLITMPALLFNPFVPLRMLLFLFFWFLAWLAGKKNNPLFTFLVIFGIVLFNLIIPYGRVLFSIGAFKITAGALMGGIQRAVTLEGLIMLSRIAIRPDLKIPGFFGELIGESFRIFSVIMSQKQRITRKNLMGDIDQLMLELSGDSESGGSVEAGESVKAGVETPQAAAASRTKPAGFVILAVVVILSWLFPWIVGLLIPSHDFNSLRDYAVGIVLGPLTGPGQLRRGLIV
jgi:heptaprenyl diphosphate synthase